jgi:hypothetical protein
VNFLLILVQVHSFLLLKSYYGSISIDPMNVAQLGLVR